ncbi:MAG TPA: PAS domain-containing sensor histidine kinase [Bacteroidales bacterium]|nr:PAS domain-containing sensor histidine kinase [Bacteroidales bacterium]
MISLDMRTVIFSFVVINIVSTLVIVFLWKQYRDRYNGIGRMVLGFSFQMFAYLLIMLRGKLPMWLSLDFGNALSLIGVVIGYTGLQEYTGKKITYISGAIIILLIALLHTWFNYINPDPTVRYVLISIAYLILFGNCAWLMIFGVGKNLSENTKLTGLAFAGLSALSAIKIVSYFISRDHPADYFQYGSFEAIMMMAYQMLIILLIISISIMLSQNLLKDISVEEEKFSTIFLTAPNAVVLSSFPDGKIIDANNGFCEFVEQTAKDLNGKIFYNYLDWQDESEKKGIMEELYNTGNVIKRECQFVKYTGVTFSGMYSANVLSLSAGKCLITSIYDITESKHLRDMIQQERNLMRTLLDNLPDAISVINSEGEFILSNISSTHFLGAKDEMDIIGKTILDFFPEDDVLEYVEDNNAVISSGKRIIDKVQYLKHPDTGFIQWFLTSRIPIKHEKDDLHDVLIISHDITEKKRAEDTLRETDKFNRSLLQTIPFGMDVVDETGSILFMGENFRKLFGNEVYGKKCWELYRDTGLQCTDCPLIDGIKGDNTEICESSGMLGGRTFEISHTGMLYHGKKAMLEIFHDITERKKNEGELIRSKERAEENERIKTAFLHNISHEIRTPMNAIVGFTNLLREPRLTPEEHKTYIDVISKSSNHLLSIVNDVIEISNVEAGMVKLQPEEFNPYSLIQNLVKDFAEHTPEKNIQFGTELPEGDNKRIVLNDLSKLKQILVNLLDNAFKFTHEGKIVTGYTLRDKNLEFFVSDTGIGIEPVLQSKVFEHFYQVDNTVTRLHEGTGIGLSISKAYVELMGGKIWLKSSPGKGSTFYFTIPASSDINTKKLPIT